MKLVLNSKELAEALGLSMHTVRQYASKNPELLPPRMNTGMRRAMWSVDDVQRWVKERSMANTTHEELEA